MRDEKGRFKKGNVSWLKDTKGIVKPNSGSFKKGHPSPRKKVHIKKNCEECSVVFEVKPSLFRVKCCSKTCSQKLRIKREGHPNWIADRTKLVKNEKKHLDSRYHEWMRQVKNRDYWKCQISNGDCSGRVEAHHILRWSAYPELRYEIKNGITLCHFHHPRRRAEEERYATYFQELVAAKES